MLLNGKTICTCNKLYSIAFLAELISSILVQYGFPTVESKQASSRRNAPSKFLVRGHKFHWPARPRRDGRRGPPSPDGTKNACLAASHARAEARGSCHCSPPHVAAARLVRLSVHVRRCHRQLPPTCGVRNQVVAASRCGLPPVPRDADGCPPSASNMCEAAPSRSSWGSVCRLSGHAFPHRR